MINFTLIILFHVPIFDDNLFNEEPTEKRNHLNQKQFIKFVIEIVKYY